MKTRLIKPNDNSILAEIIRGNLKAHKLDVPGTVYFDSNLDHLSDFYLANPSKQTYFVALDDDENVIGGIGLAPADYFDDCAELQKLYLSSSAQGNGLSYKLIVLIEEKAIQLGYKRLYLETHTNLAAAIHIYEKCGYKLIDRPESVVHSGMNRFYLKELF